MSPAWRLHAVPLSFAAVLPRAALAAALAATLVACGSATPAPSFAPDGPCAGDGRAPGTYPDLEARLPRTYAGEAPDVVDSGRTCTTEGLDTLADAGVEDVRFAGATWDLGGGRAVVMAQFGGEGVTPEAMIEFYAAGAQEARRTEKLTLTDTTVAGRPAERLDVLWGQTGQTIVAWPAADGKRVNVLLAADIGDANVDEALAAFGDR